MACILFWGYAVRVHDSQAYRKMDVTRERISRISELREILLSFETGFNLVNAAVVCAILESKSIQQQKLSLSSLLIFEGGLTGEVPLDLSSSACWR